MNSKNESKGINQWELFFKQLYGYTFKKIANAKNVYLTDKIQGHKNTSFNSLAYLSGRTLIDKFHNLDMWHILLVYSINKEVIEKMKNLLREIIQKTGWIRLIIKIKMDSI